MAVTRRVPAGLAGTRRQALAALCVTEIVSYGVIGIGAGIAALAGGYPALFAILAAAGAGGAALAVTAPSPGRAGDGRSGGGLEAGGEQADPVG